MRITAFENIEGQEILTCLTRATFAVPLLSSMWSTIAEDWKTSESLSCKRSFDICKKQKSLAQARQSTWILKTKGFFRSFKHFKAGLSSRVRRVCTYLHELVSIYQRKKIQGKALHRCFTPFKAKFVWSHLKWEKHSWNCTRHFHDWT